VRLVLLGQSEQRRAIHDFTELCCSKAVGEMGFGGFVQRIVRDKAASIGVVAEEGKGFDDCFRGCWGGANGQKGEKGAARVQILREFIVVNFGRRFKSEYQRVT
jgi:hypothetical protein